MKKQPPKRGKYNKPFAINGIFEDVIKASVSKPEETLENTEGSGDEEE